ncbi:MAG: class I SAM-dependent methyltransferase [Proteobacteria bacterium]|nr:class I SAM-dependent methyltransferase [Pseudomonadota bacterium]
MCHICGSNASLSLFDRYHDLCRITSDSKGWPRGGRLGVCMQCGAVQKPTDATWQEECRVIYERYDIYHQSGGVEAQVYSENAASKNRSTRVVQALMEHWRSPRSGKILDFGCGNGALLRVAGQEYPGWSLYGVEINDKYKHEVLSVPGVVGFSSVGLTGLPEQFEAITLVHVLERIDNPAELLRTLRPRIAPSGSLLVEVPNYRENPFDLLIADHATHFSLPVLRRLLTTCGYAVTFGEVTWVPKENTVLASPSEISAATGLIDDIAEVVAQVEQALSWLIAVRAEARSLLEAHGTSVGIFGTSNAARWLDTELGENIAFFVDEDPNRIGRTLEGRPILAPAAVPAGSTVMLPLAPVQGVGAQRRLQQQLGAVTWTHLGASAGL